MSIRASKVLLLLLSFQLIALPPSLFAQGTEDSAVEKDGSYRRISSAVNPQMINCLIIRGEQDNFDFEGLRDQLSTLPNVKVEVIEVGDGVSPLRTSLFRKQSPAMFVVTPFDDKQMSRSPDLAYHLDRIELEELQKLNSWSKYFQQIQLTHDLQPIQSIIVAPPATSY